MSIFLFSQPIRFGFLAHSSRFILVGVPILFFFVSACVSSGKFKQVTADNLVLKAENAKLQENKADCISKSNDLELCKAQLLKTEQVLAELYLRFEGKALPSGALSKSESVNLDSLQNEIRSLRFKLSQNENLLNNAQSEKNLALKNNQDLVTENSKIKQSEAAAQTKISELLNQNTTLKVETDNQQAKIKFLESKMNSIETNQINQQSNPSNAEIDLIKSQLAEKTAQIAGLNKTLMEKNQNLMILDKQNKELLESSNKKSSKKSSNKEDQAQIQNLKTQNATLNQELDKVKSEQINLKKSLDQSNANLAELEQIQNQNKATISSLNGEVTDLKKQLAESKNELSKPSGSKSKSEQKSQNQAEVLAVRNENENLKAELKNQRSKESNLLLIAQQSKDSFNRILIEKDKKINDLELQSRDAMSNPSSKNQISDLQQKLKTKEVEVQDCQKKYNELSLKPNKTSPEPKASELPQDLLNKINGLPQEFPKAGIFYKIQGNLVSIFLPQNYLFEGETIAMKEQGTIIISRLCQFLKSRSNLNYEIIGFSVAQNSPTKTLDGSYRRANTISKLMVVSGVSAEKMTVGAKPYQKIDDTQNFPAGIELSFYVN
ncbi:MAG TPA: hypothetical protein PK006_07980 [Saprospiraceae bacterium]|nr:hypothetical protein [Saprospiraceae bacterium]